MINFGSRIINSSSDAVRLSAMSFFGARESTSIANKKITLKTGNAEATDKRRRNIQMLAGKSDYLQK